MAVCDNCAIRLFNTKHYNLQGVGNPFYGRCIVVPNVDYSAYKKGDMSYSKQVEIIKSIISSTGELEDVYILPLIRCNETISCELDDESFFKCLSLFADDIRQYDFRHILLLGEAGRRFLTCDISKHLDTRAISPAHRIYYVNYSPLIKFMDADKFEVFKEHLIKWYNSVKEDNYNEYNTIWL